MALSPDGKSIAAGYIGGVGCGVVVWDTARRDRLTDEPLAVDGYYVSSVTFSPDSKTIAVGESMPVGRVVLLDVDLDSWHAIAGRVANRNFTRDEWRQYFPDEPYQPTFPDLPVPSEVPSQSGGKRR